MKKIHRLTTSHQQNKKSGNTNKSVLVSMSRDVERKQISQKVTSNKQRTIANQEVREIKKQEQSVQISIRILLAVSHKTRPDDAKGKKIKKTCREGVFLFLFFLMCFGK